MPHKFHLYLIPIIIAFSSARKTDAEDLNPSTKVFFYVGSPLEDIFSGHLLSPIFQSTLHITITSLCLGVDTVRFSCLLLCAQNLIFGFV